MALNNFYFKVNKLDVLPDHVVTANSDRYGSATKVIYGIYATAYATKNGISFEHPVFTSVPFNANSSFVSWENLTEENIISWMDSLLNVNEIKQNMENIIDQMSTAGTETNLPWSN